MTCVVLLSLDAFVPYALSPALTPRLWALACEGGYAPDGGIAPLPSVTYPAHAALLTGQVPARNGVRTGHAGRPEPGVVPGWGGYPSVTVRTLFDACAEAGLRAVAICGDHKLTEILNTAAAAESWPPDGVPPVGAPVDDFGYPTNVATHAAMRAAASKPFDLLFGHYNETDTAGHLHGPSHDITRQLYTRTDEMVGQIADLLAPHWAETVFIVVSDHGCAMLPDRPAIDLRRVHDGIEAAIDEAGFSLVRLRAGTDAMAVRDRLLRVDGVIAVEIEDDRTLAVSSAAGVIFGVGTPKAILAGHGGPETERTLALVGGGHPAVASLGASFAAAPLRLIDIAPTIAGLLDLSMPAVEGRDLLA